MFLVKNLHGCDGAIALAIWWRQREAHENVFEFLADLNLACINSLMQERIGLGEVRGELSVPNHQSPFGFDIDIATDIAH